MRAARQRRDAGGAGHENPIQRPHGAAAAAPGLGRQRHRLQDCSSSRTQCPHQWRSCRRRLHSFLPRQGCRQLQICWPRLFPRCPPNWHSRRPCRRRRRFLHFRRSSRRNNPKPRVTHQPKYKREPIEIQNLGAAQKASYLARAPQKGWPLSIDDDAMLSRREIMAILVTVSRFGPGIRNAWSRH